MIFQIFVEWRITKHCIACYWYHLTCVIFLLLFMDKEVLYFWRKLLNILNWIQKKLVGCYFLYLFARNFTNNFWIASLVIMTSLFTKLKYHFWKLWNKIQEFQLGLTWNIYWLLIGAVTIWMKILQEWFWLSNNAIHLIKGIFFITRYLIINSGIYTYYNYSITGN